VKASNFLTKAWSFLNSNAQGFNAIASILLSGMALLVSIKSCEVAEDQNALTEIQYAPHFRIDNDFEYDSSTQRRQNHRLLISNDGMQISNVQTNYRTFFLMEAINTKSSIHSRGMVEFYGYFNVSFHSNQPTGLIYTIETSSPDANFRAMMLENNFRRSERLRDQFDFVDAEVKNLVAVTYTDRLSRRNTKYFLIDSVHGGIEISEEEFNKYEDTRPVENRALLKFQDVTPAKVIEVFEIAASSV
jgi:hypothetical protein